MKKLRNNLIARYWRHRNRIFIPKYQISLSNILAQYPGRHATLIFPPGLGWRSQLFQRPQQLAQALAQIGALVFYMEPEHESLPPGFHLIQENLFLCHVPIQTFRVIENPFVYTLTWNHKFSNKFDKPRLIYDYVDNISAFVGNQKGLKYQHERLVKEATVVLATALSLHHEVIAIRPDAVLCPNGVDYGFFAKSREKEIGDAPSDLQHILMTNRKVVGYYGALTHWFDYELLKAVAESCKETSFVLIGPKLSSDLHDSGLIELPNVTWLGEKPYSELPNYLRYFDIGIIPFRLNPITHSASPLKLFEYMAAGKPVVITPMQESLRYQGVLSASDCEEFSNQIDRGLSLAADLKYIELITQVARQNTWENRANQILSLLREKSPENDKISLNAP